MLELSQLMDIRFDNNIIINIQYVANTEQFVIRPRGLNVAEKLNI